MSLQTIALHIVRFLGGFAIAQFLTRKRLRILCYHGFSIGDEHEVLPHVFMRKETFEERLRIIRKRQLPVIALDEAVKRLRAGTINHAETVLTLDDGWASNLSIGAPILEKFNYPACIYVTTEHLYSGTEVFNVALFYMLCRSPRQTLSLDQVHPRLHGSIEIAEDRVAAAAAVIREAETVFPRLSDRQQLLPRLAQALGMDLDEVLVNGRFRLLARAEMAELSRRGFDIQLHTHTHRLPDTTFDAMADEIARNREALKEILGTVQSHLCYPSGRYSARHLEWLPRLAISSATTCDPGLNYPHAPSLQLKRHLDSDCVSAIVFEAEVCGLRDLARGIRSALSTRPSASPRTS
jgi:peptidoglycan/xylan/chitin deacetylase (PgdA/CDA1 family)